MNETAVTRFWAKVDKGNNPDGCWNWTASRVGTYRQYGTFRTGGKGSKCAMAHRFAYELCVGPIGEGLQLDHLCRNTKCVNPAHLEEVTPRENTLRGTGRAAENAKKTHCNRGHLLSDDNLCVNPDEKPRRDCRACRRIRRVRAARL